MLRAILLSLALLLLCGPAQAERYKGFPRGHALIAAAELQSLLEGSGPKPVVLAAVRRTSWLLGHVPGAHHAPRHAYTDRGGMAVERERFQAFARRLGIDGESTVVVYDNAYDAARLWWLFRLYGKTDVRVLDGGWRAWEEAGYAVERGPGRAVAEAGSFAAAPALAGWTADMADVSKPVRKREPMSGTRATRRNGRTRAPSAPPASSAGARSAGRARAGPRSSGPPPRSALCSGRRASSRSTTTSSTAIPACAPPRRSSRFT